MSICNECIDACVEVLGEHGVASAARPSDAETLRAAVDRRVAGYARAKSALLPLVAARSRRIAKVESGALGGQQSPTGAPERLLLAGRSHAPLVGLVRTACEEAEVPMVSIDLARAMGKERSLADGVIGSLLAQVRGDLERACHAVVCISSLELVGRFRGERDYIELQRLLANELRGRQVLLDAVGHRSGITTRSLSNAGMLYVFTAAFPEPLSPFVPHTDLVRRGIDIELGLELSRVVSTSPPDSEAFLDVLQRPGGILEDFRALLDAAAIPFVWDPSAVDWLEVRCAGTPDPVASARTLLQNLFDAVVWSYVEGKAPSPIQLDADSLGALEQALQNSP